MRLRVLPLAFAGCMAASLVLLYLGFAWIIAADYLVPMTAIGEVVFLALLLRVSLVFAFPRLRNASRLFLLDLLSAEVFILPALALVGVLSGDSSYRGFAVQLIFGWSSALMLLVPSLVIYRHARGMYEGAKLSALLPTTAFLFGIFGALQGIAPSGGPTGPSALWKAVVSSVVGSSPAAGGLKSPVVGAAAAMAFFALAARTSLTGGDENAPSAPRAVLVLAGTAVTLCWGLAFTLYPGSFYLVLPLPTALICGVLWWLTNGKGS